MGVVGRAAGSAARARLASFAVPGLLRARISGIGSAVSAAATSTSELTRRTGWLILPAFAVGVSAFVCLGHQQSSSLAWMGLCVIAGRVAFTSVMSVALASGALLSAVVVAEWSFQRSEAGWSAWLVGIALTTVSSVFARRLRPERGSDQHRERLERHTRSGLGQ